MSIPVVVLAGFLGAGKTTVLNQLLRSAADVRIGVVVNDFGAVGIDALLVAGWADSTVSLENGCLCCSTDDGTVDELLARLTAGERGAALDAVLVEASGVAEPSAMVRRVLTSGVPGVRYGGLVVVVDAAGFEATRARHPELDDHVAMADVVLVSKTDLVDAAVAGRVAAACRELNRWAPIVPAARGQVDPRLLFEERPVRQRQLALGEVVPDDHHDHHDHHDHGDQHGHLHTRYETVEFRSAAPLDPRRFVEFLDGRPSGVFRAKGFVRFAVEGFDERYLLQVVGPVVRFERGRWPRGSQRATELVLIGAGLDADDLRRRLLACVHEGEPLDDEMAMMGVLRTTEGA